MDCPFLEFDSFFNFLYGIAYLKAFIAEEICPCFFCEFFIRFNLCSPNNFFLFSNSFESISSYYYTSISFSPSPTNAPYPKIDTNPHPQSTT